MRFQTPGEKRLEVVAWSDRVTSSDEQQVIEDAIQTLQIRPPTSLILPVIGHGKGSVADLLSRGSLHRLLVGTWRSRFDRRVPQLPTVAIKRAVAGARYWAPAVSGGVLLPRCDDLHAAMVGNTHVGQPMAVTL